MAKKTKEKRENGAGMPLKYGVKTKVSSIRHPDNEETNVEVFALHEKLKTKYLKKYGNNI